MNIDLALKRKEQGRMRLTDLVSSNRIYGTTHNEILAKRAEILTGLGKVPHWVKAYLEGYWDCLTVQNYRDHLVFGGFVGDKFYSTHHDRDDYYEKSGIEPSAYADDGLVKDRGHYWKNNLRPFFVLGRD